MKKKIIFSLVFFLCIQNIYSQYDYSDESTQTLELSWRFLVPELESPQAMGFVNFGAGFHRTIVPNIISPGFYVDAGIGMDWLLLFSDREDKYEELEKREVYQIGFNLGFRIYNLIEIGIVDITTFIGYNLVILQLDERAPGIIHNPIIGASIIINFIGLEYCYYIPTYFSNNVPFHHISIVFHFKE